MWGDDQVHTLKMQYGRICRERLRIDHVKRRAPYLVVFESLNQRVLVYALSPRVIDKYRRVLHKLKLGLAYHVIGALVERHKQEHHVRRPEQGLEIDVFNAELLFKLLRHPHDIIIDAFHSHAAGLFQDRPADAARADDARGLAVQHVRVVPVGPVVPLPLHRQLG